MAQTELESLLAGIAEGYDARAWYGPTLKNAITRVGVEEACWRPAPEQANIWELVVHSAYWKYVIRRKLTGVKRGSFPLKGSDWYARPELGLEGAALAQAWKQEVALLAEEHRLLMEAAAALSAERLDAEELAFFLRGVAMHDVYHAGQIQQIRRMFRASRKAAPDPEP